MLRFKADIINAAALSLNEIKSKSRTTTQDYYTIKSRVDFDMEKRGI
ncbi:MAG: hypothetical protein II870_05435 [Synergistaceae bacterium]|nr:hypothetical protein [Synergistaceae bacterium]